MRNTQLPYQHNRNKLQDPEILTNYPHQTKTEDNTSVSLIIGYCNKTGITEHPWDHHFFWQ